MSALVADSKGMRTVTVLQQNLDPVLSCGCRLTQADLYSGCKMVACVYVWYKVEAT